MGGCVLTRVAAGGVGSLLNPLATHRQQAYTEVLLATYALRAASSIGPLCPAYGPNNRPARGREDGWARYD